MGAFDQIKYKRNFLSNVVFRIDFAPLPSLQEALPAQIEEAVKSRFPIFEKNTLFEITASLGSPQVDRQAVSAVWRFMNEEKNRTIQFSHSFLTVEFLKYNVFEEFREAVLLANESLEKVSARPAYTRLGLRYINKFLTTEGHPLDWEGFVAPSLGASIEWIQQEKPYLARSMGQMVFRHPDHDLSFTYGLFNSEFPNPIARKEFILDFDCYTSDITLPVMETVDLFHENIQDAFERSISDKWKQEQNK